MVERTGSGLRFDTGIERIIRQDGTPESRLPEMTPILPSNDQPRDQLAEVLDQPSLLGAIDAFVRPEVHERDILLPTRFAALFHDLQGVMQEAVAHRPYAAQELEGAAKLLAAEQADRDLLETYRNTLFGA
jgi:hypothetical protein